MQAPTRGPHLEGLADEYDRLAEMLEAARPASGGKEDMLEAMATLRRLLDNTRLLFETVALETYDATTASYAEIGAALGTGPGRGESMARNNAHRWLENRRRGLVERREAEGLPARLGA